MTSVMAKPRQWARRAKDLTLNQLQRRIDAGERLPLDVVGAAGHLMPRTVRLASMKAFPEHRGLSGAIHEAAVGRSVAPRPVWDSPPAALVTRLGALRYVVVEDARIQSHTTPVVSAEGVHIQDDVRAELSSWRFRNQFIALHDADRAIVVTRRLRSIRKGLFLGGHGASNWYHWLIEILPKALLARHLPYGLAEWPLLVPEQVIQNPTFRASLDAIAPGVETIPLDSTLVYEVGELIWIDTPSVSPFNMVEGVWPTPEDYRQNTGVLTAVRNAVLEAATCSDCPTPKRIFLMRDVRTRPYNQDEVSAVARKHGFTPVYPERYSFQEQVRMFHEAEAIVGASGAAWANYLFAGRDTRGLCWTFPQFAGAAAFSNLTEVSGADLAYLFFPSAARSTHDLYRAEYAVDVAKFGDALEQLLTP